MKKYTYLSEAEKFLKTEQQLDELLFFQELLRTCEALNERFCGKAHAIADGLQPWIDALKCRLDR
jgi:hypothetical protein